LKDKLLNQNKLLLNIVESLFTLPKTKDVRQQFISTFIVFQFQIFRDVVHLKLLKLVDNGWFSRELF